ncbi:MAG: hypothetical protein ACK5NT_10965 [Pyrinomonadaceae bacterium]
MIKEPIVFSEWSLVTNDLIKRRDFAFEGLIEGIPTGEGTLFSDLGDEVFIPTPIKDFPLQSFYTLGEVYVHSKL